MKPQLKVTLSGQWVLPFWRIIPRDEARRLYRQNQAALAEEQERASRVWTPWGVTTEERHGMMTWTSQQFFGSATERDTYLAAERARGHRAYLTPEVQA